MIQANCKENRDYSRMIEESCNARILEEELSGPLNKETQRYYTCTLTVETPSPSLSTIPTMSSPRVKGIRGVPGNEPERRNIRS